MSISYRNFGSTASIEWIKRLENEDVQVLVCLTYGDNLYTEVMKETDNSANAAATTTTKLAHRIKQELAVSRFVKQWVRIHNTVEPLQNCNHHWE
jgi:hypothetical protein